MKPTPALALLSVLLLMNALPSRAADAKPLLKTGDRLVLCGDSITARDKYATFVDLFLTVCYPELNVEVVQNGYSGEDTTMFLQKRFQQTLDLFKPTFVTVMYAMNDGKWGPWKPEIGEKYEANLREIVKKFQENKVQVLLGTPGIVGQLVIKETPTYNDATLRTMRDIMERIAKENRLPFADNWMAQSEALAAMRKTKGDAFDFAMQDGAHSDWAGQVVLATGILKALGMSGDVGRFEYDAATKTATASAGHQVLKVDPEKSSIEIRSSKYLVDIPWKGSEALGDARKTAELCGFYDDLNRCMFTAKNLPAGRYVLEWETYYPDLKLTSRFPKEFDATELARGVNISKEYPDNPFSANGNKIFGLVMGHHSIHWAIQTKTLIQQTNAIQQVVIKPEDGGLQAVDLIKDPDKVRAMMQRNLRAMVVPFDHKLTLTKKP